TSQAMQGVCTGPYSLKAGWRYSDENAGCEEETMTEAPYGSWKSPITSDLIVSSTVSLGSIHLHDGDVYWLEGRPKEGGRQVLVRRGSDGKPADLTPPPFNVRTRVHEYGGGAYTVNAGRIFFTNFNDQRLYTLNPGGDP